MIVEIGKCCFHQAGIELGSRAPPDFRSRFAEGNLHVVGALVNHRIDRIDNSEHSRTKWDVVPLQTARISRPVILFMMRINELGSIFQKSDIAENSQTHATISGSSSTTKMFRVDPLFGCDIPPDSIVRAEAEKTESTPIKEIKDHTSRSFAVMNGSARGKDDRVGIIRLAGQTKRRIRAEESANIYTKTDPA